MEKETKRIVMNGSKWADEEVKLMFMYVERCPTLEEAFQRTYDETYRSMYAIKNKYYKEKKKGFKTVEQETSQKKPIFKRIINVIFSKHKKNRKSYK